MAEHAAGTNGPDRPSAISSRYLTDRDEIVGAFRVLRDQRADLQLRFADNPGTYTAKVLDLKDKSVLIEDIQPRDGLALLRAGKRFALSSRIDGLYIHCAENRAHKADSERSLPFFHVALPASLLYQQRRRAARFRLPLRVVTHGARIALRRGNRNANALQGEIIDISAGGCRAEFHGEAPPRLGNDGILDFCQISIPNLLELEAKSAVRHTSFDARRQILTCGIEFTEMQVTDRRRLEQFIQTLARISQPA